MESEHIFSLIKALWNLEVSLIHFHSHLPIDYHAVETKIKRVSEDEYLGLLSSGDGSPVTMTQAAELEDLVSLKAPEEAKSSGRNLHTKPRAEWPIKVCA